MKRLFGIEEGLRLPTSRNNGVGPSKAKKRRIIDSWGGRCWICGSRPLDPMTHFTLDHVIPRRMGGPNTDDNLRPACPRCNRERDRRLRKMVRRDRFKQIAADVARQNVAQLQEGE